MAALALAWGDYRNRLKQVEKESHATATELAKSRAGQGNRIGVLEERLARLEGQLDSAAPPRPRARTMPIKTDDGT